MKRHVILHQFIFSYLDLSFLAERVKEPPVKRLKVAPDSSRPVKAVPKAKLDGKPMDRPPKASTASAGLPPSAPPSKAKDPLKMAGQKQNIKLTLINKVRLMIELLSVKELIAVTERKISQNYRCSPIFFIL